MKKHQVIAFTYKIVAQLISDFLVIEEKYWPHHWSDNLTSEEIQSISLKLRELRDHCNVYRETLER